MQLATTRFARWLVGSLLIAAAIAAAPRLAAAHGIAGNRFFPGTLSFDDPAVADESRLPLFSSSKHPDEGGDVVDSRFSWSLFRLLTPTLGVGIDSGWVHRKLGQRPAVGIRHNQPLRQRGGVPQRPARDARVSGASMGYRAFGRARGWHQSTRCDPPRHLLRQGLRRSSR